MRQPYNPKVTPWQIDERGFLHTNKSVEKMVFLTRYAILAPSCHNSQPWHFVVEPDLIRLYADKRRWLKVADADRRELYLSLGCALENLLIAAEYFGYGCQVSYFPDPNKEMLVAIIKFISERQPSVAKDLASLPASRDNCLFQAITRRCTNRKIFEPQSVPVDIQQHLHSCSLEEDIQLYLTEDLAFKRRLNELIRQADTIQFADPAYRAELGGWIGQSVFGNSRLISKLEQWLISHYNVAQIITKRDTKLLMSSPLLGLISSTGNNRKAQVKAGQLFERLCLTATTSGLAVQPMSRVLEVPALKAELAQLLPRPELSPQHFFRLGYASSKEAHKPRRRLVEVVM
jgi:nitroreductase